MISSSRLRRVGPALIAALVGMAVLPLVAAPVQAQSATSTLVSNTTGSSNTIPGVSGNFSQAQTFTTGTHEHGYRLTEVGVRVHRWNSNSSNFTASIWSTTSGAPDTSLYELTNPVSPVDGAVNSFTAPAGTNLAPSTTYAVVLSSSGGTVDLGATGSNSETGATGWSIGNDRHARQNQQAWSTQTAALLISISGFEDTAPPAVSEVAIVSKPRLEEDSNTTGKETYGAGQNIVVDVTWDSEVTWDVSADNADIRVPLTVGANTRHAELVTDGATSGTAKGSDGDFTIPNTLRFRYLVVTADLDADGVAVTPDSDGNVVLLRNGATLKDAEQRDASLAHAGLAADAGHQVKGSSTAPANSAPTNSGDSNLGSNNAPPGTLVRLTAEEFDDMGNLVTGFADADGDPLTFTLSASPEGALAALTYRRDFGLIFAAAAWDCVLVSLSPPITTATDVIVTMTVSDPDGDSVQVTGTLALTQPVCRELVSATVNGATLTLTYDVVFPSSGFSPTADQFNVMVDGAEVALAASNPVSVSGKTITLTLASATDGGDRVTVDFEPVEQRARHVVGHRVTNELATAPTAAMANGRWLTLTFNRNLTAVLDDANEDPGAGDLGSALQRLGWAFRVSGAYKDGVRLRNLHPRVWSVSGKTVTLRHGDTAFLPGSSGISVIYDEDIAASAGAVLRDVDGNNVPGFSLTNADVTNSTPGSARPLLTAAQVAGTELTLRFDTELDTASTPAGSRFQVVVHPRGWNAESRFVSGTGTATVSGSTVTVTLGSPVEQDATVRVAYDKPDAEPLRANTGTPQPEVEDIWFAPVSVMDRTAPKLHSAHHIGGVIVLYFGEKLDTTSVPAVGDFSVTVGSNPETVSEVFMAEDAVGIVVGSSGGTVTVDYTPGSNPIRDVAGNDLAAFSGQTVSIANASAAPLLRKAETDGDLVTLTFDRALSPAAVPAVSAFKVQDLLAEQISGFDWAQTIRSVSVRGTTVVLDVSPGVFACAQARVSYTAPAENALTNFSSQAAYAAAGFSDQSITNLHASRCIFDPVRIASMDEPGGASGNGGHQMSVQFDRGLRSSSVPSKDSFTVTSGPSSNAGPIVVDDVELPGDLTMLRLTLSRPPAAGEELTLSYRPPRSNPGLLDTDGNQIAAFSTHVEVPEPPNRAPVFRGAAPGWNNAPPGTLVSLVASQADFVDPDGDPLTFELSTSRGDVHTPGLLTYGERHGRIFFAAKNACALDSVDPPLPLAFDTVVTMTATDPDGATASTTATFRTDRTGYVCASLTDASVDGATVTLDFDAAFTRGLVLDAASVLRLHTVPAPEEFVVTADGVAVDLADAGAVSTEGTTITLTLASPVTSDQTVAVSYVPGDSPVAFAFADQPAANHTPAPEPPEPERATAPDDTPAADEPTAATGAAVDGNQLMLTFNRDLAPIDNATADALRYSFLVEGGAFHHGIRITNQSPGKVAVDGDTVTLTLGTAILPGHEITVIYYGGGLHDTNGNPIAEFTTAMTTTVQN